MGPEAGLFVGGALSPTGRAPDVSGGTNCNTMAETESELGLRQSFGGMGHTQTLAKEKGRQYS